MPAVPAADRDEDVVRDGNADVVDLRSSLPIRLLVGVLSDSILRRRLQRRASHVPQLQHHRRRLQTPVRRAARRHRT